MRTLGTLPHVAKVKNKCIFWVFFQKKFKNVPLGADTFVPDGPKYFCECLVVVDTVGIHNETIMYVLDE